MKLLKGAALWCIAASLIIFVLIIDTLIENPLSFMLYSIGIVLCIRICKKCISLEELNTLSGSNLFKKWIHDV